MNPITDQIMKYAENHQYMPFYLLHVTRLKHIPYIEPPLMHETFHKTLIFQKGEDLLAWITKDVQEVDQVKPPSSHLEYVTPTPQGRSIVPKEQFLNNLHSLVEGDDEFNMKIRPTGIAWTKMPETFYHVVKTSPHLSSLHNLKNETKAKDNVWRDVINVK